MSNPTSEAIDATLKRIEHASTPARELAKEAVTRYRKGHALEPAYDFSTVPSELRQVVYDGSVRFSRRRWWSVLLR